MNPLEEALWEKLREVAGPAAHHRLPHREEFLLFFQDLSLEGDFGTTGYVPRSASLASVSQKS